MHIHQWLTTGQAIEIKNILAKGFAQRLDILPFQG